MEDFLTYLDPVKLLLCVNEATEAFEDLVKLPLVGLVVQEAEPVFSGAREGVCLCDSRLLFPMWELPVLVSDGSIDGIVGCRLSVDAMGVLEDKIRSVEKFLRSRRNQKRGIYGIVVSSLLNISNMFKEI